MKFTKKEITNAFLLYLDNSLPNFECKKIQKEGFQQFKITYKKL